METMKAITVYGPRDARMEDVKKPVATGDMIVMKVKRTGVCATDLSIFTGESSFIKNGDIVYPCRFGHEWAGVVESVGPDVNDFKPGDRVYADNFSSCGECEACKRGDYAACPNIRSVGTINCWEGCFAEYMIMPERHTYHLPDSIDMDSAALIEPGSIAYDAFTDVTLTKDDVAVVYGTGAIGMITAWLCKHFGAGKVILVGRSDEKLAVGLKIGADFVINNKKEDSVARIKELTNGKGATFLVETAGAVSALRDCILAARRYARISVLGFYEKDVDGLPIDPLVHGCLKFVGGAGRFGNADAFCEILEKSTVDLRPIITHHIPFKDCLDVFENDAAYQSTKIKIMVDFD